MERKNKNFTKGIKEQNLLLKSLLKSLDDAKKGKIREFEFSRHK